MADIGADGKDGSDDETERRERIKQVLEKIRTKQVKKKRKLPAMPGGKLFPAEGSAGASKKTGTSRHRDHKVHFGWIHFNKGSHKQVKCRQGGGTRTVAYPVDECQTVNSLLLLGKKLFFPDGRSQFGMINEMNIQLSHFDGTIISSFKDRDGNERNYQEYLKSHGLYSSQHYLYLKTRHVESIGGSENVSSCDSGTMLYSDPNNNTMVSQEHEHMCLKEKFASQTTETNTSHTCKLETVLDNDIATPKMNTVGTLLVNGQLPGKVFIKYTHNSISPYSGQLVSQNAYSMCDCESLCSEALEDINCILQLFNVTSITVQDNLYLDIDSESKYAFPQRQYSECHDFILHGPSEIFGTEDDGKSVVIGVITKEHNKGVCMFTWFKSETIFCAGVDQCMIKIAEPGIYNVTVACNGNVYSFDTPIVVSTLEAHGNQTSLMCNDDKSTLGQGMMDLQANDYCLVSRITFEHMDTSYSTDGPYSNEGNIQEHGNQTAHGSDQNTADSLGTDTAARGDDADSQIYSKETGKKEEQNDVDNLGLRQHLPVTSKKSETFNPVIDRIPVHNETEQAGNNQSLTDVKIIPTPDEHSSNKKVCAEKINHLYVEFNDFKVQEKIGEGGFGEIFRGVYLGTPVAVKKLKIKRLKLIKQSLLKGVQVNSHIRHPNIVLLMGYSIEADHIYLLSELVQGPNLDDVLFGDLGHKLAMPKKAFYCVTSMSGSCIFA